MKHWGIWISLLFAGTTEAATLGCWMKFYMPDPADDFYTTAILKLTNDQAVLTSHLTRGSKTFHFDHVDQLQKKRIYRTQMAKNGSSIVLVMEERDWSSSAAKGTAFTVLRKFEGSVRMKDHLFCQIEQLPATTN